MKKFKNSSKLILMFQIKLYENNFLTKIFYFDIVASTKTLKLDYSKCHGKIF